MKKGGMIIWDGSLAFVMRLTCQSTKTLPKYGWMDGTVTRTPETAKDETTVSPDLFTQGNG